MAAPEFHKSPECDGDWIDISTHIKQQYMCKTCRAVMPAMPPVEHEEPEPVKLAPYPVPWYVLRHPSHLFIILGLSLALGFSILRSCS